MSESGFVRLKNFHHREKYGIINSQILPIYNFTNLDPNKKPLQNAEVLYLKIQSINIKGCHHQKVYTIINKTPRFC